MGVISRVLHIGPTLFLATSALATPTQPPIPQEVWSTLNTTQWRADLKYFADNAALKHRDLYHATSQANFQAAVSQFDSAMPTLDTSQIVVRFIQLVNLTQDAHSGISLDELMLPQTPVRFMQFDDGIYVVAADAAHSEMVGGKLVGVGDTTWKDALAKVDTLISDDAGNDGQRYTRAAHDCLNRPFLLHGLGLTDAEDKAVYTIEKAGQSRRYALEASVPSIGFSVSNLVFDPVPPNWVSAYPAGKNLPLAMGHSGQLYWYQAVPEHQAVYVLIRAIFNGPGPTLADFSADLGQYLSTHPVKRVVLDLRDNPGGDNTLLRPLAVMLIRSAVNYRGGLWVLISHKTHSAAQNLVNRLEDYTDAIFVNQPTSENVNFYGDVTGMELPNSHIPVYLSALWWQDKDPRDHRAATFPEIAVPWTFEQFISGKDPALDIALSESAPRTLDDLMSEAAASGKAAVAIAYQRFLSDPRHLYVTDTESQLNRTGYNLLSAGKTTEAVAVLQVNADTHSQSANAYDSLGEASEAAGDKVAAASAYRRSLELNPSNEHAKKALERLAEK